MPWEDRQAADPVTPSSETPEGVPGGGDRRRAGVVALVERVLRPAMGLCMRVFDPIGENPAGYEKSRMIVMDCIARNAARGVTADDDGTRRVLRAVAESGLDGLVGHPGGARPPGGVDLGRIASTAVAAEIAPSGYLRYAVLQDATSPARRRDRQIAFVVLAAGVPPRDAAVLLGMTTKGVDAALERIIHRIVESEGVGSMAGAL